MALSVRELIQEVRKPGKVYLPVLMPSEVEHIAAEKADLLAFLATLGPSDKAPWRVIRRDGGASYLDTQEG